MSEHPTCRRCKREAHGWPLERRDQCSPRSWVHCLREPAVVIAENLRHDHLTQVSGF